MEFWGIIVSRFLPGLSRHMIRICHVRVDAWGAEAALARLIIVITVFSLIRRWRCFIVVVWLVDRFVTSRRKFNFTILKSFVLVYLLFIYPSFNFSFFLLFDVTLLSFLDSVYLLEPHEIPAIAGLRSKRRKCAFWASLKLSSVVEILPWSRSRLSPRSYFENHQLVSKMRGWLFFRSRAQYLTVSGFLWYGSRQSINNLKVKDWYCCVKFEIGRYSIL